MALHALKGISAPSGFICLRKIKKAHLALLQRSVRHQ
jgi:hypothetical protein